MWELWNADRCESSGLILEEGLAELWRRHLRRTGAFELVADGERFAIPQRSGPAIERLRKWLDRGGDPQILVAAALASHRTGYGYFAIEAVLRRVEADVEWPPLPPRTLDSQDRRWRAVCHPKYAFVEIGVEDAGSGEARFPGAVVHDPETELVRFITPSRLLLRYPAKGTYSLLNLDPLSNTTIETPILLVDPKLDLIGRLVLWVLVGFLALVGIAGAIDRYRDAPLLALAFLSLSVLSVLGGILWQSLSREQRFDLATGTLLDTLELKWYQRRREYSFSDFESVTHKVEYYKGREIPVTELRGPSARIRIIGAPDAKWLADRLGLTVVETK